jgi:hypothetical protein
MKQKHTPDPIGTALCMVSKVTTATDGGAKITLDIPSEGNKELLAKLLDLALNPEAIFASFVKNAK